MDRASRYNRRITAETPIRIGGPVAGHPKLRTAADPAGRLVLGTHDNCNGGLTPWGTILICEEGSADFFAGDVARHPDRAHMERNHYESSPHGRVWLGRAFTNGSISIAIPMNRTGSNGWWRSIRSSRSPCR